MVAACVARGAVAPACAAAGTGSAQAAAGGKRRRAIASDRSVGAGVGSIRPALGRTAGAGKGGPELRLASTGLPAGRPAAIGLSARLRLGCGSSRSSGGSGLAYGAYDPYYGYGWRRLWLRRRREPTRRSRTTRLRNARGGSGPTIRRARPASFARRAHAAHRRASLRGAINPARVTPARRRLTTKAHSDQWDRRCAQAFPPRTLRPACRRKALIPPKDHHSLPQ